MISTATWKLEGTVGSADLGSLKAGQSVEVTPSGAAESYVIVGLPELRTYGARLAYKF